MFPQERNLHGKVFGGFLMRMVSTVAGETNNRHSSSALPTAPSLRNNHYDSSLWTRSHSAFLYPSARLCA